ncbi:hypothetical protein [Metabacillus halosaccharovorans]|uniref:Uncharacterized protein n=1 Tax=Metabacillus halosaccharovorans TaxID=930124 RepID=A0ABT3DCX6_9BACI|nr:hypothetical protein [Metabacillus halosaccharovorans]MCV9884708.1 hypothetical protein [Metabacillus halosaccharovorans]
MNAREGWLISKIIFKELIINGALKDEETAYKIVDLVKEHIRNYKAEQKES